MRDAGRPRPLRAVILGTGGVARLHAEALAGLEGVELVAVSDVDAGGAARFAAEFGSPAVYPDLAAMLRGAEPDVVHLCTPPSGHAEQAAAAFAAGCDVIAEKPPALSLDDVDGMVAAAAAAGRQLAVVFQQRTGTAVAHVRSLLRSGALGRPRVALCHTLWDRGADYYAVPWRGTWASEGGGPTLGLGIHQIDLLAYLLGEWSSASSAFWRLARELEMEDVAMGTLVFDSGVVASVVTTVLAPRQVSVLRIDTDLATIELEHLYGHGHEHWRITPAAGVPAEQAADWAFPADEVRSGHEAYLAEVYAALRAGQSIPPVGAEPARALEAVAALYASARLGRPISRDDVVRDPALRGPMRAPITEL